MRSKIWARWTAIRVDPPDSTAVCPAGEPAPLAPDRTGTPGNARRHGHAYVFAASLGALSLVISAIASPKLIGPRDVVADHPGGVGTQSHDGHLVVTRTASWRRPRGTVNPRIPRDP